MRVILIAVLLWLPVGAALAVEPDEVLSDPMLEARARALSKELRCVVCQNQDIDSSNAGVARDLRLIVRERLVAGDTDEEVLDFVVARYGDYVLLRPPLKPLTYVLWYGPFVLLLFGGGIALAALRGRRSAEPPAALTEDEEKLLNAYLVEDRKTE